MRRRDAVIKNKAPITGPAEEVGAVSLFKGQKGFSFALRRVFPWLLTLIILAFTAWAVKISLNDLSKPYNFGNPKVLYLLLAIPLLAWYSISKVNKRNPVFGYSRLALLSSIKPGIRVYFTALPSALKLSALGLVIFALANPQITNVYENTDTKGIDIVLALDVSLSMKSEDLPPNRFIAAKNVMSDFVSKRKHDRIGLVLFGQYAYPYCPLTLDHKALIRLMQKVELGSVDEGKATAIGEALGTALNMLQRSKSKSKVIILLTDGANNSGEMGPKEAARYASALGVKIHTILVGNPRAGGGLGFFIQRAPVDPELLEYISAQTGGNSYLATDKQALKERFQRILNKMKKNKFVQKIKTNSGIQDKYIIAAFLLLFLELLLSYTWLRRNP